MGSVLKFLENKKYLLTPESFSIFQWKGKEILATYVFFSTVNKEEIIIDNCGREILLLMKLQSKNYGY